MSEPLRVSRRAFLGTAAATTAPLRAAPASVKVINAHDHLHHHGAQDWYEYDRRVIVAADKLGVEQICCSILPPERPTSPQLSVRVPSVHPVAARSHAPLSRAHPRLRFRQSGLSERSAGRGPPLR